MRCRTTKKHNKKGFILGICMVVLSIIMVLCSLILGIIAYGNSKNKLNATELEIRTNLDMIGEDFADNGVIDSDLFAFDESRPEGQTSGIYNSKYVCTISEISESGTKLEVRNTSTTLLLTVERNSLGRITKWSRTLATN